MYPLPPPAANPPRTHSMPHTEHEENKAPSNLAETSKKVAQMAMAGIVTAAAIGSLAIGITITPFIPPLGCAAIALSLSLFALAGAIFHNANQEESPDLRERRVSILV